MSKDNTTDKGKASKTGSYFRIDSDVLTTYAGKVPSSKYGREEIIEKLIKSYNEKGDNIFILLNSKPF